MAIPIKNNGSPSPTFQTDNNRLYFLTIFFIHPHFDGAQVKKLTVLESKKSQLVTKNNKLSTHIPEYQKVNEIELVTKSDKCALNLSSPLAPLEQIVLEFCKKQPCTTKMLAKKLDRNPRVVYRTLLKPLLEKALIKGTNPNPRASNQTYIAIEKE